MIKENTREIQKDIKGIRNLKLLTYVIRLETPLFRIKSHDIIFAYGNIRTQYQDLLNEDSICGILEIFPMENRGFRFRILQF